MRRQAEWLLLIGASVSWLGCAGPPTERGATSISTSRSGGGALPLAAQAANAVQHATRAPQSVVAAEPVPARRRQVQPVSHERSQSASVESDATLRIAGRTYRLQLVGDDEVAPSGTTEARVEDGDGEPTPVAPIIDEASMVSVRPISALESVECQPIDAEGNGSAPPPTPVVPDVHEVKHSARSAEGPQSVPHPWHSSTAVSMNLPTALSMVGGRHPAVGFAQWRVQEAYAQLDRSKVLWLPSIQPGFSFHRHDGNYQASDGTIVDVNRNSFQAGLGTGATGAGTTPRPGVVARFHVADAIFQPQITQKTAWARGHAANGVINEQLLNVATAYIELLEAVQDAEIVETSRQRTEDLSQLTSDFADAGQGLKADADRMDTELRLVEDRLATAHERVDVASARLSEALSLDTHQAIAPLDPTVVPIDLVPLDMERDALIQTGLRSRPELKEAQALVAAACEQYRREKYAPFVPSVLLGFSTGGFGGGLRNNLDSIDDRYDFDALVSWEVRNLGLGEGAARRETAALLQQAKYRKIRVLDQVARQVAEAHAQATHRAQRIDITQRAIQSAEDSYRRNLSRIRDGQGLPLEVLQSVRALEDARRSYLTAITAYNVAQFRLQWALGWPSRQF